MLLSGCDLFSTREFRPKPPEIRSLHGLSAKGDSLSFRVTESLWNAGAASPARVVSSKRLVFTALGDSLEGADSLKILSLAVIDDASGALLESSVRVVRFASEGVFLEGSDPDGGARFFPLKTASGSRASGAGVPDSGSEAQAAAQPGERAFMALPSLFVQGWVEEVSLGILKVRRELAAIDTLQFQGRLEEVWVIAERVLDGDRLISEGIYRYGSSGLLKVEQAWTGFDGRDSEGRESEHAELRRLTERL